MKLQVLGCGDAFGTGGRFNTCFLVDASSKRFLIDCGASSLIAMRRYCIDPNSIDTIFLTHLHGDHYGGLPFLLLEAQLVAHRSTPLTVVGPPGLTERLSALMEAMFPGSSTIERGFEVRLVELVACIPDEVGGITVTAFVVKHPSGSPSYALRLNYEDKIICYTGDTAWVDEIITAARGADLFIADTYTFDKPAGFHLDFATLRQHLPQINAKVVLLTHMGPDALGRTFEDVDVAEDGRVIHF